MLRALEELKCAAAGAQAAVTADFGASSWRRRGWGRKERLGGASPRRSRWPGGSPRRRASSSPASPRCYAARCRSLDDALRRGRITERSALALAQETACLELRDRREVGPRIAGDLDAVERLSERQIIGAARAAVAELDPAAVAERRRRAEAERCVTAKPAPDTMMWLTSLMPVKDGVAVWAVLSREADRARAAGDPRSRGQIMADTLRDRVLGRRGEGERADADDQRDRPRHRAARRRARGGLGPGLRACPGRPAARVDRAQRRGRRRAVGTPALRQSDDRRVRRDGLQGRALRGQAGRVPQTARPGVPHRATATAASGTSTTCCADADGGPTSAVNGQGACETCNYAKEGPGWSARPRPGPNGEHIVEIVTPTGHRYLTRPPTWNVQDRGYDVELFSPAA